MKKHIIFLAISLFLSSNASSAQIKIHSFKCPELAFAITPSLSTINFSNIELFSIAEMVSDLPIGFTSNSNKTLIAKYHWHSTTVIELRFSKDFKTYNDGEVADVILSFDDNDGIYLEDQSLKCKVADDYL